MAIQSFYHILSVIGLCLVAVLALDRLYQRFSHRWTNEPPMLPYRIPIVGHALMFGSDVFGLFRHAECVLLVPCGLDNVLTRTDRETFPNCQPYSLMMFGKRLYVCFTSALFDFISCSKQVFPDPKDVSTIFRNPKSLPFLPLIESLSGLAWDISPEGMKILTKVDPDTGDSLFRNAHVFYREALKPGPQLDTLTLNFLKHLNEALDAFDRENENSAIESPSLMRWSKQILGTASTNAMMGPTLLRANPDLLPNVWLVEEGFFLFINKVPRIFARKQYEGRDRAIGAFDNYFAQKEEEREGCVRMIGERERELREAGLNNRDVAAYSYSAYAALLNNANPMAYHLLRHIFSPTSLSQLRAEVAPAFALSDRITTLDQLNYLIMSCPLLRAFYYETLRVHSANSSNRKVVEETLVGGYTLRVGRNVLLPSYVQHNKEEYFGSDTSQFNPERFLESASKKANPKMVRAFGGGVSLCSGRHFASSEILSYTASILWKYNVVFQARGAFRIERRDRMTENNL